MDSVRTSECSDDIDAESNQTIGAPCEENRPAPMLASEKMPTTLDENVKFNVALFDRNRGPRPPVPGEETAAPFSDGTGGVASGAASPPPPPPPPLDPWKKRQILRGTDMTKAGIPHPMSTLHDDSVREGERPADFAPEGSAAESTRTSRSTSPASKSDCSSSTSSSSSSLKGRPPCFAWANSLQNLLADSEGVQLFQDYLKQEECSSEPLKFCFACRGIGMQVESGQAEADVERLCKVIYRKFLRSNLVAVSETTLCAITEKLGMESSGPRPENKSSSISAESSWSAILTRAQQEVEDGLSRSTYANFLESDLYLQAVSEQIESRRRKKLEREERKKNKLLKKTEKMEKSQEPPTSTSVPLTTLTPLLEDEEASGLASGVRDLQIGGKRASSSAQTLPLTKSAILATMTDRLGYTFKADSNRQLFPSVVAPGPLSPHDGTSRSGVGPVLTGPGVTPSVVSGGLPHPYHAMYKAYVPVSRQDSELQSLSSDALTDDTMSTLTDDCASSVDGTRGLGCSGSCCVKPGSKAHLKRGSAPGTGHHHPGKHHHLRGVVGGSSTHLSSGGTHMHKWQQRRQQKQMRINAEINKESIRMTDTWNIPRPERPLPDGALAEKKPAEFAEQLIAKLELVLREREMMSEIEGSEQEGLRRANALSFIPPQLLEEAMQENIKAASVDDLDSDQAILDNHVNRVWADSGQQTPKTPPGPAKRPVPVAPTGLPPFAAGFRASSRGVGVSTGMPSTGPHYVYAGNGKPPGLQPLGIGQSAAGTGAGSNPAGDHHQYHHRAHHHRKRDKEISSSLSSDSGNVFDSRGSLEGLGASGAAPTGVFPGFPKSKSVPEWLVDAHNQRQHQLAQIARTGPGTDSGVSGTSADSAAAAGASGAQPISPNERVLNWMMRNERYDSAGTTGAGEATAGGSSEKGSSHRQSRASSSAATTQQQQQPAGLGSSSSRSSHRRHGGVGGLGVRSVSMERRGRLSWKQQFQQMQEHQAASQGLGTSVDDSGVHLMQALRDRAPSASKFIGPALSKVRSKNEVLEAGVGIDDESGTSTVITWVYGEETVPFRSRLPGTLVTLKQFKQLLPRKGHYRYYFKKEDSDFGSGFVHEEISDDSASLPLWEGKVFAMVKQM